MPHRRSERSQSRPTRSICDGGASGPAPASGRFLAWKGRQRTLRSTTRLRSDGLYLAVLNEFDDDPLTRPSSPCAGLPLPARGERVGVRRAALSALDRRRFDDLALAAPAGEP